MPPGRVDRTSHRGLDEVAERSEVEPDAARWPAGMRPAPTGSPRTGRGSARSRRGRRCCALTRSTARADEEVVVGHGDRGVVAGDDRRSRRTPPSVSAMSLLEACCVMKSEAAAGSVTPTPTMKAGSLPDDMASLRIRDRDTDLTGDPGRDVLAEGDLAVGRVGEDGRVLRRRGAGSSRCRRNRGTPWHLGERGILAVRHVEAGLDVDRRVRRARTTGPWPAPAPSARTRRGRWYATSIAMPRRASAMGRGSGGDGWPGTRSVSGPRTLP